MSQNQPTNERPKKFATEPAWTRATIHQILTNEKYIGNNIYNRRSYKLKRKRVVNGPDMWIRSDGAFEAIIEPKLFHKVRIESHFPSRFFQNLYFGKLFQSAGLHPNDRTVQEFEKGGLQIILAQ